MTPTKDQLEKLPKWAKKYIRNLERAHQQAVKALDQYMETQKPSSCWYDEHVCDRLEGGPSRRRVYIQSSRVEFGWDDNFDKTLRVSREISSSGESESFVISGTDMQIAPCASNQIEIRLRRLT